MITETLIASSAMLCSPDNSQVWKTLLLAEYVWNSIPWEATPQIWV